MNNTPHFAHLTTQLDRNRWKERRIWTQDWSWSLDILLSKRPDVGRKMGHLKPEEVAEIGFTLAVLDQNEDGLRRKSGSGLICHYSTSTTTSTSSSPSSLFSSSSSPSLCLRISASTVGDVGMVDVGAGQASLVRCANRFPWIVKIPFIQGNSVRPPGVKHCLRLA